MLENSRISFDIDKIKKSIQANLPLSIMTYTLPHEMEIYMSDVLTAFLKELNQENLIEYLTYCLNELVTNAKKANTKRVYFDEKNLDINNSKDYVEGMKTFKTDTLDNIKHYLKLQKEKGYYIKFIMQVKNNKLRIEVRNNVSLTLFEYKRIHDKLARAQQYTSADEAFTQVIDDSEGAGLGLIIMILMLKKVGLTEDNYQVFCENGETVTRIILPLTSSLYKDIAETSESISNIIDDLPQFPENIRHINQLLNDPEVKLSAIGESISSDVSLTASLLKLVNSAVYARSNPCCSVVDAVMLVGTRGIQNFLYTVGTLENLGTSSEKKKALWRHCYKVGFYAYNIGCNYFPRDRMIMEDSYVCGLLHDMGKIIFDEAYPDLIDRFKQFCLEKNISDDAFEKITAGATHSEIGAKIAEKWNFPSVISETIRYHHCPENAPEQFKNITSLVYLANMLANYEEGLVDFYQIEPEVLARFKIKTEEQFIALAEKIEKIYDDAN